MKEIPVWITRYGLRPVNFRPTHLDPYSGRAPPLASHSLFLISNLLRNGILFLVEFPEVRSPQAGLPGHMAASGKRAKEKALIVAPLAPYPALPERGTCRPRGKV